MLRFERRTNDSAELTGAIGLACFAIAAAIFYSTCGLESPIPLLICGLIGGVATIAFFRSVRNIIFPTTRFIDIGQESLRFGSVEREASCVCINYPEIKSLFIDFEERQMILVDSLERTRVVGKDLVLTGQQLQKISDILSRQIPSDRLMIKYSDMTDLTETAKEIDRTHDEECKVN